RRRVHSPCRARAARLAAPSGAPAARLGRRRAGAAPSKARLTRRPLKLEHAPRTRGTPMTYAQGRVINDADSHIMELPDFLRAHPDPTVSDDLPRLPVPTVGALAVLDPESAAAGRHSPAKVAELVALGDRLIAGPKGHAALGAFN